MPSAHAAIAAPSYPSSVASQAPDGRAKGVHPGRDGGGGGRDRAWGQGGWGRGEALPVGHARRGAGPCVLRY